MRIDDVKQARLKEDPRVLSTDNQELFMAAAQGLDKPLHPTLTILRRSEAEKTKLKRIYKKVHEFMTLNASVDLTTRVFIKDGKPRLMIPTTLIELGAEADLLKTANIYAQATKTQKMFLMRPSTVLDADEHTHDDHVLSVSIGGPGLAVDFMGKQTAQLEELDFGMLSPKMPHRSPYRSAPGRMVMFVAPPLYT